VKKWVSIFLGLFLIAAACASNDDDNPGQTSDGARTDGGPLPDSRPQADARPFVDAGPVPDGVAFGDGGLPFGDGGLGDCATDDDCEEGECCAELIPGFGIKVCTERAPDAGPGECTIGFP